VLQCVAGGEETTCFCQEIKRSVAVCCCMLVVCCSVLAVCCSVLAVCCSVLAVCCSVLQMCCRVRQCAAVCCGRNHLCLAKEDARRGHSVLQCVGSVLQCAAVCCIVLQYVAEEITCVVQTMPEGVTGVVVCW